VRRIAPSFVPEAGSRSNPSSSTRREIAFPYFGQFRGDFPKSSASRSLEIGEKSDSRIAIDRDE
jgi:hypothetical protein